MSVTQILRDAKALTYRAHTPTQLAVDARGVNVRPQDPTAVAWSITGALGKVAGARSVEDEKCWFDLTTDAMTAWELLNEAARLQGYMDNCAAVVLVDQDGLSAVLRVFAVALRLAPSVPSRDERNRVTK